MDLLGARLFFGLYGSHVNSCKIIPEKQGTGKRELLSRRALSEQNSAAGNLADIFFCNREWQLLEQKKTHA